MGMHGSERAYQDFYEEDFCNCLTVDPSLEICDMLVEEWDTAAFAHSLTLFDQMHWDCVHCALQLEKGMRADAEFETAQLESEIDSLIEALELERRVQT